MNLWIIATVSAYYIKGLCGFANTHIFTSILSFGESNTAISSVDLLLGYPKEGAFFSKKILAIYMVSWVYLLQIEQTQLFCLRPLLS